MPGVPPPEPYQLPNIPSNAYTLLSNLATAIDTANTKLTGHANKVSDINTSTNNAVGNVVTTSKGQATNALNDLWTNSKTDLGQAHDQLVAITTSRQGIGPGPSDFQSTLDQSKATIQTGLTALDNLRQHQSSNGVVYLNPLDQQMMQWKQDVDQLDGAIANINMALDMMAMAIRNLNNGFRAACATGLVPGQAVPLFNKNAFAHQMTDGGGGGKGGITAEDLIDELKSKGVDPNTAELLVLEAEEHNLSPNVIKALLDTGVDPEQLYNWILNDNNWQLTDKSVTDLTSNVNTLVSRGGGDPTDLANWIRGLNKDQLEKFNTLASQNSKLTADDLRGLVDPNLKYDPNPKHDQIRPGVGPQPTDGQRALDNSVSYKSTTTSRIAIDPVTQEIVVLDDTNDGTYHGHVEKWSQLDTDQQNALTSKGFIDSRGRVIIRDSQGNIKGYGRNVEKEK